MKKLLMLLAVTFAFTFVNAQATTKTSAKSKSKAAAQTEVKSCDKSKAAEGKACCSKTSATDAAKSCDKSASTSEVKACCASKTSAADASVSSCGGASAGYYAKTVNAVDFMAYADRFPSENIVDLRSKEEVKASGMIKGAIHMDYNARDFKEKVNALDKEVAIMVYTQTGKYTSEAVKMLQGWGFKKVYNLDGGYDAYAESVSKKK